MKRPSPPTRWPEEEPPADAKMAARLRRAEIISRKRFGNDFVKSSIQGPYPPGTSAARKGK